MDIENLIKDTFAEHEHVVPDGDAVLDAARRRIDRRRAVLSRPLVVAAGVVAMTLAAVTFVALNRPGSSPEDKTQVAGPATSTSTEPAIADLSMPYSLGWLPPGEVDYLARRINIGGAADAPDKPVYGGEYMLNVTDNGQVLTVDVQQFRMIRADEASFKSGPGLPVEINGQHGVESSESAGPGGYELYVTHPDGGTMYVNVGVGNGSTASAQQLIDAGRRIAENIHFPGTTTVTPAIGLRDLPNGLQVCSFDVERGRVASDEAAPNTSYTLGTCDIQPTIYLNTGAPRSDDNAGTPGEPVQGHATHYVVENGYITLTILDAVHGNTVTIASKLPLTDLYAIANNSLVLPS